MLLPLAAPLERCQLFPCNLDCSLLLLIVSDGLLEPALTAAAAAAACPQAPNAAAAAAAMLPLGLGSFTRAVCNRARRGLYAGRIVRFGNQISEDGGNK